ncbi:RNA-binding protein [Alkalimonas collagenimarina]|uniref:RNA-binding protein n=1 Tax=Alkalimonas collagenimarina TaxID=400390 RepID=A0ABT9GYD2_9GAMM|nr:RNA-binding protein [Alkalimonas collagenimarina]MDP4536069.1 RNA-binding protein [Alkalimonas collagenimarina]
MLPILRATLPFTIVVAIVAYIIFYFINSEIPTALSVVIGVLLGGVLVPILRDLKGKGNAAHRSDDGIVGEEFTGDSATLYVGNLPYRANEEAVQQLFETKGVVINVRLMKDRQTGRRRGFGFVEVAAKDADKMINALNDSEFQERTLKVREAKDRQEQ